MANLETLMRLSLRYGTNPDWILFGGGNTSVKEGKELWVKGSGVFLKDITESGFVGMNHRALEAVWDKQYPEDPDSQEAEVLKDILAARLPGQQLRPSVDVLLHSFVSGKYCVHSHPVLINGMTCAVDGQEAMEILFGDTTLWTPFYEPGYVLAANVRKCYLRYIKEHKRDPKVIFMQNRGLFIHADTEDEINELSQQVWDKVTKKIKKLPETTYSLVDPAVLQSFAQEVEKDLGPGYSLASAVNKDILSFSGSSSAFKPIAVPFTCDQMLYSGVAICRLKTLEDLTKEVIPYKVKFGRDPLCFFLDKAGLVGIGKSPQNAEYCLALAKDAVRIAMSSGYFGGQKPATRRVIYFILNWEAEKYRTAQAK